MKKKKICLNCSFLIKKNSAFRDSINKLNQSERNLLFLDKPLDNPAENAQNPVILWEECFRKQWLSDPSRKVTSKELKSTKCKYFELYSENDKRSIDTIVEDQKYKFEYLSFWKNFSVAFVAALFGLGSLIISIVSLIISLKK